MTAFHGNVGFNAHHAPMGAFFSFTCGHFGTRGGLGAELGKPADQDLYIGVKLGGRYSPAPIRVLPFYQGAQTGGAEAFTVEQDAGNATPASDWSPYRERDITRTYLWATDTWKTPDFDFSIYTPFGPIPEPSTTNSANMRAALLPAVTAELVVDNRRGTLPKTAFFAINCANRRSRALDENLSSGRVGFGFGLNLGVAGEAVEILPDKTRVGSEESGIKPFLFMRWDVQEGLAERTNAMHRLGSTPGIGVEVPPGRMVVLRLAMGCYLEGVVTSRLEGRYLYTKYFTGLLDVLNEALTYVRFVKVDCNTLNDRLLHSGLNADQQFLIAHATRSYYGATQLLDVAGQPYWIVNEGEYCMLNTLDLAVDQQFWELQWNPWIVRNLLDNFVRYYSYHDQVKDPYTGELHPGGISFCHDQGVFNHFSPFGESSYELKDLQGCFSYMTQEQLCNWILIAACYVARTGDTAWARRNGGIIEGCLASMIRRDHPNPANVSGIMRFDSSLCGTGQEITSYDSLDASLAQARNNLYIAVKCWASYLGLLLLGQAAHGTGPGGEAFAVEATARARAAEETILKCVGDDAIIPAIFEKGAAGHESRILPAIEGLLYPLYWRTLAGPDAARARPEWKELFAGPLNFTATYYRLLGALESHTSALLADAERRNKFEGGGIRLSSTSDNSWASKIAIVQHLARELFSMDENGRPRKYRGDASGWEKSDAAHTKWQTEGASAYWACSDQIVNGVARGSKYYPRIITAALWLNLHQG